MNIEVTNLQSIAPLDEDALQHFALAIMDRVRSLSPSIQWRELSIVLTDDPGIQQLNHQWFQRDAITDVISFAYPDDGFGGETGEVILNVQHALEEGRLRDGPDLELALYLAHGCHHLTGAQDDTPQRKQAMLARERAWVGEIPVPPFFP